MTFELVNIKNSKNSSYKEWFKFYKKYSFNEYGDYTRRDFIKQKPYYYLQEPSYEDKCIRHYKLHNNEDFVNEDDFWINYGIKKGCDVTSLFAFDDRMVAGDGDRLLDIDDFLVNPDTDLFEALRSFLITFQKMGYGAIKLDCRLMYHHHLFIDILKKLDGTELILKNKKREPVTTMYYIIPLKKFKTASSISPSYKNHNLCIGINGINIETTCSIIKTVEDNTYEKINSCDKHCGSYDKKYKTNYITVIFDKPLLYCGTDDIFIDKLEINSRKYKDCESKENHSECDDFCNSAVDYRRLNKLNLLELGTGYSDYNSCHYGLLYGFNVPKDVSTCDKCGIRGSMVMCNENKDKHRYIHEVPYHLSLWMSQFSLPDNIYKKPILNKIDIRKRLSTYTQNSGKKLDYCRPVSIGTKYIQFLFNNDDEKKTKKSKLVLKESEEKDDKDEKYEKDKKDEKEENRKSMPRSVRDALWINYFGESFSGKCYCCKEELKIIGSGWHCGHIVSVKDGGKDDISNLRPVCACCNLSMGTENMDSFKSRYFPDN